MATAKRRRKAKQALSVLEQALARHRRRPQDPYWCRRLCEQLGPFFRQELADDLVPVWEKALARVISYDPIWFVSLGSSDFGHLGLLGAPPDRVARVEKLIAIPDRLLAHYVKGTLWLEAVRFSRPPQVDRMRYAATHLLKVKERHRTDDYFESVCDALEHVDYDQMKPLFEPLLAGVASEFAQSGRVVFILSAAARAGDWATFDIYRPRYDPDTRTESPHRDCQVLNCDGLRELALGKSTDLQAILVRLIERGMNVQFLGGPGTTTLVEALLERNLFLEECRSYLEVVRSNEGPRSYSSVDALIARFDSKSPGRSP